MKKLTIALVLAAGPALASEEAEPFFSLYSTEFVVTVAFLLFIGILLKFKVPGLLMKMLDKRAEGIANDLAAAKALHDEAKAVLASFERKRKEVQEQAGQIVDSAKREAVAAAEQAKVDLQASIERRLKAAEDQIASAEASAVRAVRDQAIAVATAAAGDVIAKQMSAAERGKLIDAAIADVEAKLH